MQFRDTWIGLFDGTKTMTRRIAKPGDRLLVDIPGFSLSPVWYTPEEAVQRGQLYKVLKVYRGGRLLWALDDRYAIQRGRGLRAIGTYRMSSIRCERLQSITPEDAYREGVRVPPWPPVVVSGQRLVELFRDLWSGLWRGSGYDWDDNPIVYPIGIRDVERIE